MLLLFFLLDFEEGLINDSIVKLSKLVSDALKALAEEEEVTLQLVELDGHAVFVDFGHLNLHSDTILRQFKFLLLLRLFFILLVGQLEFIIDEFGLDVSVLKFGLDRSEHVHRRRHAVENIILGEDRVLVVHLQDGKAEILIEKILTAADLITLTTGGSLGRILSLSLSLSLSGLLTLDGPCTLLELRSDLLSGGDWAILHPWVAGQVSEGQAVVRVKLEHVGDHVLELLREEAGSLVA